MVGVDLSQTNRKSRSHRVQRVEPTYLLISKLYVIEDNTPPGPIFKARLLHMKSMSAKNRVSLKRSDQQLSEHVSLGIGIVLRAEQPSFENRPWGGSCVTYGIYQGTIPKRIQIWMPKLGNRNSAHIGNVFEACVAPAIHLAVLLERLENRPRLISIDILSRDPVQVIQRL